MSKVNKVFLIGRVGRKPELKTGQDNFSVVTFSLATNESYKDSKGEKVEKTEWHNIVVFGKPAPLVHSLVKTGSYLHIEGKIQTRQYTDSSGVNRYTTEIICNEFLILDKIQKDQQS